MAALSEVDLKRILGEGYREIDLNSTDPAQMKIDAAALFKSSMEKLDNASFSAVALVLLGLVLLISNQLAISGPSLLGVSIFGAVVALIGAAWYIYVRGAIKKLGETKPTKA